MSRYALEADRSRSPEDATAGIAVDGGIGGSSEFPGCEGVTAEPVVSLPVR